MPNIKSAEKRVKVIAVKTARNKAHKSRLKTDLKKAELALATGGAGSAQAVRDAIKTLDESAARGIIHRNAAARRKSTLATRLNQLS